MSFALAVAVALKEAGDEGAAVAEVEIGRSDVTWARGDFVLVVVTGGEETATEAESDGEREAVPPLTAVATPLERLTTSPLMLLLALVRVLALALAPAPSPDRCM